MNGITPQKLIEGSLEIFSLPDIYYQVSQMINDPRFSADDIGQVIAKDPGLSARLLKIVNSSFYGFQAKIDTISRAITIVGMEDLKSLVFATSVIDKFDKIPTELVDMSDFWMHSVQCGLIAKLLAKESAVLHCERLFLTGLIHNLGALVLYNKMPEKSLEVLLAADYDRRLVGGLEQEIIGFTHADVGAELIKQWGLPESLYEAVACYLNPGESLVYWLDTNLLCMAAKLSLLSENDSSIETVLAEFSEQALITMRLDVESVTRVMEKVELEFMQIFENIAPEKRYR